MKERLNLVSYGVQEITMIEAQEINGGLAVTVAVVGNRIKSALEFIVEMYVEAVGRGMRNACSCCN